jgi:hypothetical protein
MGGLNMGRNWVSLSFALVASLGLGGCAIEAGSETEAVEFENVGEQSEELVGNAYVVASSTMTVSAYRDVTVTCPTGKYVYGAGYATYYDDGTNTDATLRHSAPSADGRSWRVKVRKPQGLTAWRLSVTATCAPKVTGYEIKATEVAIQPGQTVTQTTACGATNTKDPPIRAVGGGYGLYDAAGAIAESTTRAQRGSTASWIATMNNPTTGVATGKTYAICVPKTSVQEHTAVATSKPWPNPNTIPVSIMAFCPVGGLALSGGFQLLDQAGSEIFPTVHESRYVPNGMGQSYGWKTTVSKPSAPSKQVPTTLKQTILCVKDLPN